MARWLLTLLALSAVAIAVVLAVARPGALSRPGTFAQPVAAVAAIATPWAYIDKVENGAGWCDPTHIDTTTTEYVGDTHQFALCVGNLTLGQPVDSFQATIGYDGALDECIDEPCQPPPPTFGAQTIQLDEGCVDDNPDANAGVTTWPPDSDGLGTGWSCFYYYQAGGYSLGAVGQDPTCDVPDHGSSQRTAGISCHGTNSYTLGDNETWGALAVINMNVIAAGVDEVDIQTLQVRTGNEVPIIACPPVTGFDVNADSEIDEPCQGATDIKRERHRSTPEPSPTSTATPEPPTVTPPPPPPPPTATPSGGVGPQIVGPATGSGPTDSGTPWAVWLAAGIAGAAAGGLYLRRATR